MNRVWVVLLAVLLASAPAGLAQKKKGPATRSVSGEVTSADDQGVVGAVVQLKDTKTLQVRSFITQDKGQYVFHGLSPDIDYELNATYKPSGGTETASKTKKLSSFDSKKAEVINLKLESK